MKNFLIVLLLVLCLVQGFFLYTLFNDWKSMFVITFGNESHLVHSSLVKEINNYKLATGKYPTRIEDLDGDEFIDYLNDYGIVVQGERIYFTRELFDRKFDYLVVADTTVIH